MPPVTPLSQVYDAKKGTFTELGMLDVQQIFGRAGRPQFDTSGEANIITAHSKLAHYLGEPYCFGGCLRASVGLRACQATVAGLGLHTPPETALCQQRACCQLHTWEQVFGALHLLLTQETPTQPSKHTVSHSVRGPNTEPTPAVWLPHSPSHPAGMLTHAIPIESQFKALLPDNLNAEIVLGSVSNVKEAVNWLTYTYLAVRMRQNPLVYGITYEQLAVRGPGCFFLAGHWEWSCGHRPALGCWWNPAESAGRNSSCHCPRGDTAYIRGPYMSMYACVLQADPALTAYSRDIIVSAAKQLHAAKMAVFDERSGNLFVTELGRVASHFYIRWAVGALRQRR